MLRCVSFPKLLFVSLVLLLGLSGSAALPWMAAASSIPVASVINADGTLNLASGMSGSLNLTGWNVNLDPQRGPVLAPAVLGSWERMNYGVNNAVFAIAVSGNDVYVGGAFDRVCETETCGSGTFVVNHIAKWDGSSWSPLGFGLDGAVNAITVDPNGTDFYLGGDFTQTCANAACNTFGLKVNEIVKFSTVTNLWSALGNGVGPGAAVNAILVQGSDVYVGGRFKSICGNPACDSGNVTVNRIARWSNSTNLWTALNNGLDVSVNALGTDGIDIYVGGDFTSVCGNAACNSGNTIANRIVRWSPLASAWATLGNGTDASVYAIAVSGDEVYVGGGFSQLCGEAHCNTNNTVVHYIARWSIPSSTWSALGNGVYSWVSAIIVNGNDVYVGGVIPFVCVNPTCDPNDPNRMVVNNIARWDGNAWSPVGYGVTDQVKALGMIGERVYAGGFFVDTCTSADCTSATTVNQIARFTPNCSLAAVPQLLTPNNKSIVKTLKPTLKWADPGCLESFTVTVKDAITGAQVFKKANLTALQVKTSTLVHGKKYKWFLNVCTLAGCAKSATWQFTVQ